MFNLDPQTGAAFQIKNSTNLELDGVSTAQASSGHSRHPPEKEFRRNRGGARCFRGQMSSSPPHPGS